MKKEVWKDIQGYEGFYEASSFGNIRSTRSGKVLKLIQKNSGYTQITISIKGVRKLYRAHRLTAITFLPNPNNLPVVNHKNGIKNDNRVENLEWCTHSENDLHAYRNDLRKSPKAWKGKFGTDHIRSVPVKQFSLTNEFIAEFPSMTEVHRQLGIPRANIYKVCLGQRGSAGGFKWRYA